MFNIALQVFGAYEVWNDEAVQRSRIEGDIVIYEKGEVMEKGTAFSWHQRLAHFMLMARWGVYTGVIIALGFLGIIWFLVFVVWKKC